MDIKDVKNMTPLPPAPTGQGRPAQPTGAGAAQPPGSGAAGPGATSGDRVHLTDIAARLHTLEASLGSVPIVDTQRVAAVQQTLAQGRLTTHPQRIAGRLLEIDRQLPPPGP